MLVKELANKLELQVVSGEDKDILVKGVYIGDLLSIVIANSKENNLWITIQTHLNVLAVAELIGLSAIIIAENMDISEETINKSKELGIPLLKSKESSYQIACKLNEMGI